MDGLRDLFCGCLHRHITMPFTSRQRSAVAGSGPRSGSTYVVCLDCGREFPYSWEDMRIVKGRALGRSEATEEGTEPRGVLNWLSRRSLKRRPRWASRNAA